ncbi:alpha/beta hydrolase [Streptomyces sp. NPDC048182]|uniref:alpha/beta hydrolase n=1 Tax=unclassified Streptomyces TaxID=2593676 RepID=UPI0033AF5E89
MTSFDTSPHPNVWRLLLALAVVFVMLATTGWTALRNHRGPTALEASVAAWDHGRLDGRRLPDARTEPSRLALFFATLDAREGARLADRYPLAVGNMNGAPVELRYRANRAALTTARTDERERLHDPRLSPAGQREAGLRMDRYTDLLAPGRHVLAFDPAGSGRVAEVFGDLDRARRVSVVVPGVDTDLLTYQRTGRRYSAPAGMAGSLYDAERAARPGARTAVIAWADYTAPSGLGLEAATAGRAVAGAHRLNALLAALPGRAPVSLFCHSYGSVVCGRAAATAPSRVADIAVAGSPGMRTDSAAHLHTAARVWAMRDADDWIADVPNLEVGGLGHGADPVSPAFGARLLSAHGAHGHAGYFVPGTESLENFAEIGVGAYRDVACAGDGVSCRAQLPASSAA